MPDPYRNEPIEVTIERHTKMLEVIEATILEQDAARRLKKLENKVDGHNSTYSIWNTIRSVFYRVTHSSLWRTLAIIIAVGIGSTYFFPASSACITSCNEGCEPRRYIEVCEALGLTYTSYVHNSQIV